MIEKDAYREIMTEYEQLRQKEEAELEARKEGIYEKFPRIEEIDIALKRINCEMLVKMIQVPILGEEEVRTLKHKCDILKREKAEIFAKNGIAENALKMQYRCELCRDTGYVGNKQCNCLKQRLIARISHMSNMEQLFETQNFKSFKSEYYSKQPSKIDGVSPYERMRLIYKACRDFTIHFDDRKESLLFYGPVGIGKTFLSSCIAKELIDSGKTVVYESAFDLCSLYEDYKFMRLPAEAALPRIDRLYQVDLLIIDDLGTEPTSKNAVSFIFNLVDTRIRNSKSTIISTNLNLQEISKIYSQRLSSRIFENFKQLEFIGTDIRLQKMVKKSKECN